MKWQTNLPMEKKEMKHLRIFFSSFLSTCSTFVLFIHSFAGYFSILSNGIAFRYCYVHCAQLTAKLLRMKMGRERYKNVFFFHWHVSRILFFFLCDLMPNETDFQHFHCYNICHFYSIRYQCVFQSNSYAHRTQRMKLDKKNISSLKGI